MTIFGLHLTTLFAIVLIGLLTSVFPYFLAKKIVIVRQEASIKNISSLIHLSLWAVIFLITTFLLLILNK